MYRRVTFPARMLRLRPFSRSFVGAFLGVTGRVIFLEPSVAVWIGGTDVV
jgi:hypothetical protein